MNQKEIDRHKSISIQLGMPRGTAANRLRKLVLFDVLQRHKENICYRCNLEIQDATELSIEHKKPWEGIDTNLFWDLSNVAFSHLQCNIKAANHNTDKQLGSRKIGPTGTSWCSYCKKFKFIEEFSSGGRWNGLDTSCKDCKNNRNILRDRKTHV